MKPTKKAMALLKSSFMLRDQILGFALHTSEGTAPLWGQLHLAGLVVNKGRGLLGHSFWIELTNAGKNALIDSTPSKEVA